MRLRKRGLVWGLAMIALAALPVRGDEPVNKSIKMPARESFRKPWDSWDHADYEDAEFQRRVKITVSPAMFPYPLLKYRFNVYSTELEFGNAAPLYSQAYEEFEKIYAEAEKNWYASSAYYDLKKSGASEDRILAELFRAVPLEPQWPNDLYPKTVSPEEEAKFYQSMEPVYRLLEKASRMRDADWSYQMEYKGIDTSLEHLQDMRTLARYLCGKSDWEIRNGRYGDAVKTLRVGIAMGNHLSKANFPTLVGLLVGIAVQGIMQNQIMLLESQPDAPNLYPALTQINFSTDGLQYAIPGEQAWPFPTANPVPIFENIDRASPEECRERLENIVTACLQVQTMAVLYARPYCGPDKSKVAAAMTAVCTLCYPQARDRLLERGRTAEEIERLPVYQVVAPFVIEQIKVAYDRLLITTAFPAGSSHTAIVFDEPIGGSIQSPVDVYLLLIMPGLDAATRACHRQTQTGELLKITEAIRYYAAVHDGRLPESLDAIKEVVIATVDPMTGKPFGYKVVGRTALIDFMHVGKCRLEITVEETAGSHKAEK
jgi:hypothetical protein